MHYKIEIKLKADPSRNVLKARKNVAQGKERALKGKLRGMIREAKSRLKGLENAGIDTPAKQKLLAKTDLKTKGKNYNQLQSTYFAVDKFLKSQTASVKGATQNLNQIARIIGLKNVPASEIIRYARQFFEIASYAKQALNTSGQSIGSTRLFEAIRKTEKKYQTEWNKAESDLGRVEMVLQELQRQQAEIAQDEFALYVLDGFGL